MRYHAVVALLAALPPILIVGWSLTRTLPQLSDPCFQWGLSQSVNGYVSPNGPCRALEGSTETKPHAVVRLVLVHGGILVATVLGVLGALLARPLISVLGAGLIFLESIPLIFSFAWLTVFVSGLFLLAARENALVHRGARVGMRLIGSLAALAALLCLPALSTAALFLLFLLSALAFTAVVALWPVRAAARNPSGANP